MLEWCPHCKGHKQTEQREYEINNGAELEFYRITETTCYSCSLVIRNDSETIKYSLLAGSDMLLTDEEIRSLRDWETDSNGDESAFYDPQIVAKAQSKKMVEWGDEPCEDRTHSGTMPKRQCGFCWQSLRKEVE